MGRRQRELAGGRTFPMWGDVKECLSEDKLEPVNPETVRSKLHDVIGETPKSVVFCVRVYRTFIDWNIYFLWI